MNNMAFKINLLILVVLVISSSVSSEEAKCGDLLSELKGEFTSPNYPNRYPHKANCTWTIQAEEGNFIHLTFEEFHVKNPFSSCNKDWVELIYYKNHANDIFCDKKEEESAPPALIKSTTNKLTIRLISDIFFSNGEGFLAKYYVVDKYDNKLAGGYEEEDPVFDPHWDDATTETTTTPATSTTPPTTPPTTPSTTPPTTPSTTPTTTSTTSSTTVTSKSTTTLLSKIISMTSTNDALANQQENGGITTNPGAMSGAVIGSIIGVALLILLLLVVIAFIQWKKHNKKRINLSVIATPDDKTLISDNKIYKRLDNKVIYEPEGETFPL